MHSRVDIVKSVY